MFPGSFQKLAEYLQGKIQGGAGEEEFQAGIKESAHCTMEAGVGRGWADWSQLGHGAKQPGAWGPGHSQPPQSHPTPLLREPQWVTTWKNSLTGERKCKGKRCV